MGQRAASYCRVSTTGQSYDRQERDLATLAGRAGCQMVGICKKIASGVKLDQVKRRRVLVPAQRREIDAVLMTGLSRRGRSTTDLLVTLKEPEARHVSLGS